MELHLTPESIHRLREETWFDLARWGREYRLVNGDERNLFYHTGIRVRRGEDLTPKQVRYLEKALRGLTRKLTAAGYALAYSPNPNEPLLYRPCPTGHKVERLSAGECPECGQPFPGLHPEVVGGMFLARARQRDARRSDSRVFHVICECGHKWSWTGAHRALRARCPECGRHPAEATYLDGETLVKVPRKAISQLGTPQQTEELEGLIEVSGLDGDLDRSLPPGLSGPNLASLFLVAAEPSEVSLLRFHAVGYFGSGQYWMDIEDFLLNSALGAPRTWAPVSELLERAGVSEEYLEELVRTYGLEEIPRAIEDDLEARLQKAFAACARKST